MNRHEKRLKVPVSSSKLGTLEVRNETQDDVVLVTTDEYLVRVRAGERLPKRRSALTRGAAIRCSPSGELVWEQ